MLIGDSRLPNRVWKNIYPEPNTGCWLWVGRISGSGYGSFTFEGKRIASHRVMLRVETGYFGENALHSCDTPACCNPDHLRWGTNSMNQQDSVRRKRHVESRKTHCPRGHLFTEESVYRSPNRPTKKECRECRNRRAIQYYWDHRSNKKEEQ